MGRGAVREPDRDLQTRVSQLRRALDEAEPGARDLVQTRSPGYLLMVAAIAAAPASASALRNDDGCAEAYAGVEWAQVMERATTRYEFWLYHRLWATELKYISMYC